MENNPTAMTPEQGIRIIETMLSRTQQKLQTNGFMYRFWGYLVLAAALIHYAGMTIWNNQSFSLVWAIMMPVGGLISWYIGRKESRKKEVRTYMDQVLMDVLTSFFVCMGFSLLFGMSFAGWNISYAFVLLSYGSWLYISGGMLKFRALKAGGIINWIAGAACFFFTGPQCLLILAAAVLAGYIIPGHLIQQQYTREHGQN